MLLSTLQRTLRLLPDGVAVPVTFQLLSLARRLPRTARDDQATGTATVRRWGARNGHTALQWGTGPLVILVHGWGGRAAQMAPLALHLAGLGLCVVAPDMTGHGDSPGRRISFAQLVDDLAVLVKALDQDVYALVGHSAGGMTMMAARTRHGIRAQRYVCLNAPRAPYPPIQGIRTALAPRQSVLDACRARLDAQFDQPHAFLEQAGLYRYQGQGRLLLVYDHDDDQVDHDDAQRIAQGWPDATVLKTNGLGHHRVMWAPQVHHLVGRFLQPHATPSVVQDC